MQVSSHDIEKSLNQMQMRGRVLALFGLLTTAILMTACANQPELSANSHTNTIILLGEVHDNPDGHRSRFEDLQKMVESGWRPAIAMEQFDRENQAILSKAQTECADAECIISKVGGKRWQWSYYQPAMQLALRYQLPLLAANVSRSDAARVMRDGFASVLDAQTINTFKLNKPLPIDLADAQRQEINIGHCGKLPADMAEGMVNAQVVRDVWMAKVLSENAKTGVVLLAGNGHVRRDLGVPRWLPEDITRQTQIHGYIEPATDADASKSARLYDFTHIVTAHIRPDPCKSFEIAVPPKQ